MRAATRRFPAGFWNQEARVAIPATISVRARRSEMRQRSSGAWFLVSSKRARPWIATLAPVTRATLDPFSAEVRDGYVVAILWAFRVLDELELKPSISPVVAYGPGVGVTDRHRVDVRVENHAVSVPFAPSQKVGARAHGFGVEAAHPALEHLVGEIDAFDGEAETLEIRCEELDHAVVVGPRGRGCRDRHGRSEGFDDLGCSHLDTVVDRPLDAIDRVHPGPTCRSEVMPRGRPGRP